MRFGEAMKTPQWYPELLPGRGPAFQRLLESIEDAISTRKVAPGTQLPTSRELAKVVGLSVATVMKTYAEGQRKGLLHGQVGRGTFVANQNLLPANASTKIVDLSLNVPGPAVLSKFLLQSPPSLLKKDISDLVGYLPHFGVAEHRRIFARWLAEMGLDVLADNLVITNGAQHALSLALGSVCRPSDKVFVEAATYHGMKSYAHSANLELIGLAMDDEGLRADSFEEAAAAGSSKVLFTIPTIQSPTARIMSAARRNDIARIARKHDILIIEDDAYGFLHEESRPLATIAPERTLYINTFSKSLAPGLRVGMLVVPERFLAAIQQTLLSTCWMTSPISALMVAEWIQSGMAAQVKQAIAKEAKLRASLATQILRPHIRRDHPASFHIWLDLPLKSVQAVAARALQRGVITTPSFALLVEPELISGLRIAIGVPENLSDLEWALRQVATSLEAPTGAGMSII